MTQSGVSRAGIGIGWMVVTGILFVAVLLFLMMFSGLLWNVVTVLYRQRYIPNAALGRVNSIYRFLAGIHCCFGALASCAIVVWAKPELGHGLALRMPFFVTAAV